MSAPRFLLNSSQEGFHPQELLHFIVQSLTALLVLSGHHKINIFISEDAVHVNGERREIHKALGPCRQSQNNYLFYTKSNMN